MAEATIFLDTSVAMQRFEIRNHLYQQRMYSTHDKAQLINDCQQTAGSCCFLTNSQSKHPLNESKNY
jgi:hypothetical protein